jgi:hypothetical protein
VLVDYETGSAPLPPPSSTLQWSYLAIYNHKIHFEKNGVFLTRNLRQYCQLVMKDFSFSFTKKNLKKKSLRFYFILFFGVSKMNIICADASKAYNILTPLLRI